MQVFGIRQVSKECQDGDHVNPPSPEERSWRLRPSRSQRNKDRSKEAAYRL